MKKTFLISAITLFVIGLTYNLNSSPDGAPSGYANDKASNYKTCATSGCHTGFIPVNLPNATLTSNIGNNGYVAGQTYTITASIISAHTRFGFEISPQDSLGNYKGILVVTNSAKTKITGTKYITHTTSGNSLNSWTFNWIAPAINSGGIQFSGCILSTNSNNSTSGDSTYKIGFYAKECFSYPTGINANAKGNSATITYVKNSCASGYKIMYKAIGSSLWKYATLPDTNSKVLYGLSYVTNYEYAIASINGATLSAYSDIKYFTTLCQCDLPIVVADSLGSNAVKFLFADDNCGVRYKIQYRKLGASFWTSLIVGDTTNYVIANNLKANTNYEWRFRRECNSTGTYASIWSAIYSLTTSPIINVEVIKIIKLDDMEIHYYNDGSIKKFIKQK
jgi:hypothetical protein